MWEDSWEEQNCRLKTEIANDTMDGFGFFLARGQRPSELAGFQSWSLESDNLMSPIPDCGRQRLETKRDTRLGTENGKDRITHSSLQLSFMLFYFLRSRVLETNNGAGPVGVYVGEASSCTPYMVKTQKFYNVSLIRWSPPVPLYPWPTSMLWILRRLLQYFVVTYLMRYGQSQASEVLLTIRSRNGDGLGSRRFAQLFRRVLRQLRAFKSGVIQPRRAPGGGRGSSTL